MKNLGQLPNITQDTGLISRTVEIETQADSKGLTLALKYLALTPLRSVVTPLKGEACWAGQKWRYNLFRSMFPDVLEAADSDLGAAQWLLSMVSSI